MTSTPDLIDRAIARLRQIEPNIDAARLAALEDVLRAEFGGVYSRTARRSSKQREAMHAEILRLWRHKSAIDIARALGIHRSTVHRVLSGLRDRQP